MPIGKWETATAVIDDKIYLFGGYTQNVRSSKRSDIFDPEDGNWTRLQDLPSAVSHMNAVLDGRTLWFAGGFKDGYRGHAIAEVWNYDIDLDRYAAAPLLPEPRGGGGLALVGANLHYIGGQFRHDSMQLDQARVGIYDPETDSWASGPALPKGYSHAEAGTFVHEGRIYMVGGHTTPDGGTKSIATSVTAAS